MYGLFGGKEKRLRFERLGVERSHINDLEKVEERMNEIEQLRDETESERELGGRDIERD